LFIKLAGSSRNLTAGNPKFDRAHSHEQKRPDACVARVVALISEIAQTNLR
jgi:hypothetical protein